MYDKIMKLGEALVKEALITKHHLSQALERQIVFGGRIGTKLNEPLIKILSGTPQDVLIMPINK